MKKRLHLIVHGRVQGVCYRMYTKSMADSLGLTGFVRNLPDGNVEIVAEGKEENLINLMQWSWKGSPYSCVTSVESYWEEASNKYNSFFIAK